MCTCICTCTCTCSRCSGLRHLDLTFATDTLAPSQPENPPDSFNSTYTREVATLCRALATSNNLTTVKLLMCNKAILKELARCSKLQVLEMVEASGLRDADLAEFSMGEVRHHLTRQGYFILFYSFYILFV